MEITLTPIEIHGRTGYSVLRYELINGPDATARLVRTILDRNLRCADFPVLLDLEKAVPEKFHNTGVIWALGPLRGGISGIMSTVVFGMSTNLSHWGVVQAGVSIYGIDLLAHHSFLVRPNA